MSICRLLATAAACFVVGCADFRGYCDAQLLASRNRYLAGMAFIDRGQGLCEGRKHFNDFRKGFHAGYYHVVSGDGGVAPLVPPDEYWASCYQDADGREMINDWFAGFNEGAFAAAQDGVGELAELPTWFGGQCCDQNDRILARGEPQPDLGPRKPRRGDPPARAKLPPPAPKIDLPKNSEGKSDRPSDPTIEMPLPSEAEAPERDDSGKKSPKGAPAKKTPAKNDTTQMRIWKKAAPIAETKAESKPQPTPPVDRWARREAMNATPVKSSSSPREALAATPQSTSRIGKTKQPDLDARIPVNPFLKTKPEPNYPVAPPVLPSVGIKSSPIVEQPAQKSSTVEDVSDGPPPPAPAKPLERMEAKRALLDSKVEPTSHFIDEAPSKVMDRREPQRPLLTTPQNDLWRKTEPAAPAKPMAAKERKLMPWDPIVERPSHVTKAPPPAKSTERVEPSQPSSTTKQQELWVQSKPALAKTTEQPAATQSKPQPIPQKPVESAVERPAPASNPESPPWVPEDEWGTPHDKRKGGSPQQPVGGK